MKRYRWALLALVLLAFVLRVHHLDYESLWLDEADALRLASAPLSELVGRLTAVGENGPLYFLILRGWVTLTGESEFALRALSLLAGVATVALFGALGHRLGGHLLGLAAAALAASSSYLVYYSQEAKMYAILAFLSTVAGYLLVRAFAENRWWQWLAFLVTTTLAMYTHVFGALLIPAALAYALARPRAHWHAWKGFASAFACLTLPYLPLAAWQLWALSLPRPPVGSYYGAPAYPDLVRLLLRSFGTIMPGFDHLTSWLLFGGLALVGIVPFGRRDARYPQRCAYLAAYFLVPSLLAAMLFSRVPIFLDRYLTPLLPAVLLAMAGSVVVAARCWRPLAFVPLGLWLAVNLPPWYDSHVNGLLLKDAWRPASRYLAEHQQEGDALLFVSPDGRIAYEYYVRQPYRRVETIDLLGRDRATFDRLLQERTTGAQRYWVVLAQYAQEDVDDLTYWLVRNATKVDEVGFKGILVSLWLPAPPGRWEPRPSHPTAIDFDGRFALVGYDLTSLSEESVTPRCTTIPPRCVLTLRLYWQAGERRDRDIRVSLRFVDREQRLWGQFDLAPNPFYPLAEWRTGAIYRKEWYLPLLPGTPPGRYQLLLTAYDAESGETVPATVAGRRFPLATLGEYILRPPVGGWLAAAVPPGPSGRFGAVQLLSSALAPAQATLGEALTLTTFWAGERSEGEAQLKLVGREGIAARWSFALPPGSEVVAVQSRLALPPTLRPGDYRAELQVLRAGQVIPVAGALPFLGAEHLSIGQVSITDRPVQTVLPAGTQPLTVTFAGGPQLAGFMLAAEAAGGERPVTTRLPAGATALLVTLAWRSSGPTALPYSVFVHLLGESERPLVQHDGPPGALPTTAWLPGEVITDRHRVPLTGLPAGRYRIVVGLYDPLTLERLSAGDGSSRILLGTVEWPGAG